MNEQVCDPNRLTSFARGEFSVDDELELTRHLDDCATCGQALERQVAEAAVWREASAFLGEQSMPDCDVNASPSRSSELQIELVLSQLAPTDDPESLGRIGGYEVTGVVGCGGMGVVLKARDQSLDRVVAVKVMAPHLAASGSARQRFAREAKAAAGVLHPNVIAIHGVSNEHKLPYLVMPYVAGHSLQKRIDEEGPLPLVDVLRIGAQIAAGLAAAHDQGLVHRDIKPGNILTEQGVERVSITDFGLARAVDDASMTRSGVIAGTPQYMSPEQARGEPIDRRSDLFSLGSLLYAMCTGHSPFRAETSYGVLHRITHDRPRPIRETNPAVPAWFDALVTRLLARRAEDRFQSASEVAEVLEDCLSHVQHPESSCLPAQVAKLASARSNPSTADRGGFPIPFAGKWIGAGFAFFALLTGVVFLLDSGKGTLRVETNGDVNVKVRILQGEKTVDTLTVTRPGAETRLRAGRYELQIDGDVDNYVIDNGSVSLDRGGETIVKVSVKPSAGRYQYFRDENINDFSQRYDSERLADNPFRFEDRYWNNAPVDGAADPVVRRTVQVLFEGLRGLMVCDDPPLANSATFYSLPHRTNYGFEREIPLAFQDMGHRFFGTLQIAPPNVQTAAFLAHNSVPVRITGEDLDQIQAGQFVRKIVVLATKENGSRKEPVETIVSHKLPPAADIQAVAKKRGVPLADLKLRPASMVRNEFQMDYYRLDVEGEEEATDESNASDIRNVEAEAKQTSSKDLQNEIRPPAHKEILQAVQRKKKLKDNELSKLYESNPDGFRFVRELISTSVDDPKVFALIGPANVVTSQWKCTVYFNKTIHAMWPVPHTLTFDGVSETVTLTQRQLILKDGRRLEYPEDAAAPSRFPLDATTGEPLKKRDDLDRDTHEPNSSLESEDDENTLFPTGLQLLLPGKYRLASRTQEQNPKMTLNGHRREFSIVGQTGEEPSCRIIIDAELSPREAAGRFQKTPVKLRIEAADIELRRTVQFLRDDDGTVKRLVLSDPERLTEPEQSTRIANVRFVD